MPRDNHRSKLRRRFNAAKADLLATLLNNEPAITPDDADGILDATWQHVDSYVGIDSVKPFKSWLQVGALKLACLLVTVREHFPNQKNDWLLSRLFDYAGDPDDLESLEKFVNSEVEQERQRQAANVALVDRLANDAECCKAVRFGIRSSLKGRNGLGFDPDRMDEIEQRVWLWVIDNGEKLRIPGESMPARLFKLAQLTARGHLTECLRRKRKFRGVESVLAGRRAGIPTEGRHTVPRPSASYRDEKCRGSALADRLQYGEFA